MLRAIMIGVGAAMVERFGWLLYVFAAFLIVTGIKMWRMAEAEYDVAGSPLLRWVAAGVVVSLWKTRGLPPPSRPIVLAEEPSGHKGSQ